MKHYCTPYIRLTQMEKCNIIATSSLEVTETTTTTQLSRDSFGDEW